MFNKTDNFLIFATPCCKSTGTLTVKIVLLSIVLMAVAVLLLGVKVLFVKGGKFPSGHVHDNEALRRKGMSCHRDE